MAGVLIAMSEAFVELRLTVYLAEMLLLEPHWHGKERVIDELCDSRTAFRVNLQAVMEKVDAVGT